MKLSIIVPTLNEEKLLENVLEKYTRELRARFDAELVVSDGGSTDGTLEIADRHADVVVRNTDGHRQTIAEGRHQGATVAQGAVLIFINGDTYPADLDRFFTMITEFAERKGRYARASALACAVRVTPEERKIMDVFFHGFQNTYVWFLSLLRIGAGRGECQIVRKDVYDRVGGYDIKLAAGEDFDLFARIGLKARVRFARELLVYESPRRFRKFGYFRVLLWWTTNALSVLFTGRSSSDEWEPVR